MPLCAGKLMITCQNAEERDHADRRMVHSLRVRELQVFSAQIGRLRVLLRHRVVSPNSNSRLAAGHMQLNKHNRTLFSGRLANQRAVAFLLYCPVH